MTALPVLTLTPSFLNFLTLTFQFSFFNFPFNELVVSLRAENPPTFAYETANVHIVIPHRILFALLHGFKLLATVDGSTANAHARVYLRGNRTLLANGNP